MKKIAVVTATRAEYGILKPLIAGLMDEPEFQVQLLVTGTHLSKEYGNTQEEIIRDHIPIAERIPILEEGNSPYDVSLTMANALRGFADYFRREKPDLLIVLGDRTELLGICCGAMNENIPIAHLHGGELTEGAVDDCVRHAITKMSYYHFPSAEVYRKRIIQMGEAPERVFCVGALGVENIRHAKLLSHRQVEQVLGIPEGAKYVMVTFHPVTLEAGMEGKQVEQLAAAIKRHTAYQYIVTKANADVGGRNVNRMFQQLEDQCGNVRLVSSLGAIRYLSAVKYSAFVLGNSSSGIIEAPALGTPAVNIGDRQRGRLMADTVINCEPEAEAIGAAMDKAAKTERRVSELYGTGDTSKQIVKILREQLALHQGDVKKQFYDLQT